MNVLPNVFRGRQDDDKWEHDLFEDDDKPRISSNILPVTFPRLLTKILKALQSFKCCKSVSCLVADSVSLLTKQRAQS